MSVASRLTSAAAAPRPRVRLHPLPTHLYPHKTTGVTTATQACSSPLSSLGVGLTCRLPAVLVRWFARGVRRPGGGARNREAVTGPEP